MDNQAPPPSQPTDPSQPPAPLDPSQPTPPVIPPQPPVPPPPTQPLEVPSPTPTPSMTPQSPPMSPNPVATPPSQKKKGNMLLLIILVIVVIIVAVGGYLYYQHMQKAKMAQMAMKPAAAPVSNVLTIGVDSTYPPMESVNSKGQYVGFDIDMGNMIAKDLGKKAVWKTVVFSNIFNALNQGKYDIIISAITITPQRAQLDDFSTPYLNAGEVLIVKKTNTSADNVIETPANFVGKKIGVQSGTTDLTEALKLFPPSSIIQYPSNIPAVADLQSGKIDAIITDLPDAIGVISQNADFRVATNPLDKEYYGIVFRKNETQLRTQVDSVLANLQDEGILQQLSKKWLGQ